MKKILFKLNSGKKVKLYCLPKNYSKKKDVSMSWIFFIFIDEKEFRQFTKEEQQAIIYHELYHNKFFNHIWAVWCALTKNYKEMKKEEFEADKYSAIMCGKYGLISVFKKAMKNKKYISIDNMHPTFLERIKKLQKFNDKKYNNILRYKITKNLIYECKEGKVSNVRKLITGIYKHKLFPLLFLVYVFFIIIAKGDAPFDNYITNFIFYSCFMLIIFFEALIMKVLDNKFDCSGFGLFGVCINRIFNKFWNNIKNNRRKSAKSTKR